MDWISSRWCQAVVLAAGALLACGVGAASGGARETPVAAGRPGGPPARAEAPSLATAHGFQVRAEHPRLWWNPERLARARAWLSANPFTPGSSDWFHIAWKHVVAGTDCGPAIAWALKQQVASRQISPRASGSDHARWYGEDAIVVFDWCHDQLTPEQRRAFLHDVGGSGQGWVHYLAGVSQQEWGGPKMTQSNYNWGNLRNGLLLGVAAYTEAPEAAQALLTDALVARWRDHFVPAAKGTAAGGVGQEGTAYAAALLQYPIVPFATVENGGRSILGETDYFKQAVLWILYGTTPAPTHSVGAGRATFQLSPFGDDELQVEGGVLHRRNYYQNFMTFAAGRWGGEAIGQYARRWVDTVGAHASVASASRFILAQDTKSAARPFASLPLDYYATGVQYLFGRKAWDDSSTWFMWQMGKGLDGSGHEHVDPGNFNIWRGGRWLTRETTGYSEQIAAYGHGRRPTDDLGGLIGHNVIAFGTPLYVDDAKLMPSVHAGQPIVRRLESRPGWAYAAVDLTNRYRWAPQYAGYDKGAVVHVERELLFLRELETTLILDRITTGDVTRGPDAGRRAADQVNTFVIHFETSPTLEDATHLTAVNGGQALRMTTLLPASPVRRVIDERACSGCTRAGQWRVELDASGAAQRYFLTVLQARDAKGRDLSASLEDGSPATPERGTFTVTLRPAAGPPTVVVLEKGRTSRGGTVSLGGASPVALAPAVQRTGYTDEGPTWGP